MAGTRRYGSTVEDTVKLTILMPEDVDRQLRALAARRGGWVGPVIRKWIIDSA